jgi:hypothetical protein
MSVSIPNGREGHGILNERIPQCPPICWKVTTID